MISITDLQYDTLSKHTGELCATCTNLRTEPTLHCVIWHDWSAPTLNDAGECNAYAARSK